MRPGRIDHFIDEMVRLANMLGYSREFVKDKARIGMTANLRHVWAHVDPPQGYMEYLDRLHQTGHQLEDVSSFNQIVTKDRPPSHKEKSDDRQTSQRKQRRERKTSGPRNPKPANPAPRSFRPPESEHAKAHKDIAQTLIDRRKRLDQCSRCGNTGHFWRKCPATHPVVASAKLSRKRTSDQAGHRE